VVAAFTGAGVVAAFTGAGVVAAFTGAGVVAAFTGAGVVAAFTSAEGVDIVGVRVGVRTWLAVAVACPKEKVRIAKAANGHPSLFFMVLLFLTKCPSFACRQRPRDTPGTVMTARS
jgi:hypothetical protein